MVPTAVLKVAPGEVPLVGHALWGQIYGDSKGRFRDGHYVHTSKIKSINVSPTGVFVSTLNSVYKVEESV